MSQTAGRALAANFSPALLTDLRTGDSKQDPYNGDIQSVNPFLEPISKWRPMPPIIFESLNRLRE
jgi:hypothetical protein